MATMLIADRLSQLNKLVSTRIVANDFPARVHARYLAALVAGLDEVGHLDAPARLAWIERAERLAPEQDLYKWFESRLGFVIYMAPHPISVESLMPLEA